MSGVASQFSQWLHDVFVVRWDGWIILGFVGQALFMMRFIVQWFASEKAKKSVMPVAFWFFSLGGGVILLIYAIRQKDPVFIAGQGLGLIVYIRNLWLIRSEKKNAAQQQMQ